MNVKLSLAVALLLGALSVVAHASGGADLPFSFKADTGNQASLQRGARNYMSYCSGCHSLKYLRYNRLGKDLGIPEDLLQKHLMPEGAKPGDVIRTSLPADSEKWFGRIPPDLTLSARERGPDWVYSYLLSFYLDPSRPTGVDNLVLPGASMPHVLGELQGYQTAHFVQKEVLNFWGSPKLGENGQAITQKHFEKFDLAKPGSKSPAEYKTFVADLTNFMTYAAEPGRNRRISLGWKVLAYVLLFWGLAYLLKKEYWKDVH